MCESGNLDEYTKETIIDMLKKVVENLAARHEAVREGVKSVMGGQVLDYKAKRILKQEVAQGLERGKLELLQELVKAGLISEEEAAQRYGKSVEEFRNL